jgi:dolichol kinase
VTAHSETARQIVHVAMAGFALLLRVFTWPQAAALAGGALIFNLFLLRRVAPSIVRPAELRTPRAGIVFYPLSILILVLVFRERLDIVAAAWGVMAFGDGMATLAGRWNPSRALPWNPGKTWSGLMAFVVFGAPAAAGLSLWVAPAVPAAPEPVALVWMALAGTIVAALVETLPTGLDDTSPCPRPRPQRSGSPGISTGRRASMVSRAIYWSEWP